MLHKPSLSIFVAIQIIIWRHAARGQPNQQIERSDQESVNPPANPADCEEECQCEDEDDKEECKCKEEDDIRRRCVREKKYCPMLLIPINVLSEGSCRKANSGDECRFKCKENFTLEGRDKIFCRSTLEWSDGVPQCKEKKYCPILLITIDLLSEGSCSKANPEDECRFKCIENLTLVGRDTIFCRSTLEWSDRVPHCKEKKYCPPMTLIPIDVLSEGSCRKASPGDECRFKCKENFRLVGRDKIFCGSNLEWSDAAIPQCIEKEYCPGLKLPDNANWQCTYEKKANPGDSCRFNCKENWTLVGIDRIFCRPTFEWSDAVPQCKEFCPKIQKPKNGDWKGNCEKATPGQYCEFKCNDGYKLQGHTIKICRDTFTWNGYLPRCIKNGVRIWPGR